MNAELPWWQQESPHFLNDVLAFVNASRTRDEAIGRCDELCKGLNMTWNVFFQYRSRQGQLNDTELQNEAKGERSDAQPFRELLLHGLTDQQTSALCASDGLVALATLTPHILNHNTLLKGRYDPLDISEDLRKKASQEHRQFTSSFERFAEAPNDPSLKEALLKKTATLIYVVRSNIAHSQKTPHGPDVHKRERDRVVSDATARVAEEVLDILFDRPSRRLAVYGTLAPDGANACELAGVDGAWRAGTVDGIMVMRRGLSEFHWTLNADAVSVKVISSPDLREHFDRLDRFEGPRDARSLVPVQIDGKLSVCNIYQGKRKPAKN